MVCAAKFRSAGALAVLAIGLLLVALDGCGSDGSPTFGKRGRAAPAAPSSALVCRWRDGYGINRRNGERVVRSRAALSSIVTAMNKLTSTEELKGTTHTRSDRTLNISSCCVTNRAKTFPSTLTTRPVLA